MIKDQLKVNQYQEGVSDKKSFPWTYDIKTQNCEDFYREKQGYVLSNQPTL